ncbi:MAG: acylphosphatase [bacterium]|nr:acylphosphatase [bacterium]
MSVRANIVVKGVVQGVGFRWFVIRTAEKLKVTGWVKNNYDGSVEIDIEGDRSEIEILIGEVKVGPRSSVVTDVTVKWLPFENLFTGFNVKY